MGFRAALIVIALFVSVPFAAAGSYEATGDVSGRTILFDLTKYDPHLAAVAGYAAKSSSWFDGTIIMERGNEGYVYATPQGADDPTRKTLFPSGTWYNFTDDNGATWHVQEWYYLQIEEYQYMLAGHSAVEKLAYRTHVWTVETVGEPITDLAQNIDYNFVIVVDVTKLQPMPADPTSGDLLSDPEGGIPTDIAARDIPAGGTIDIHFSTTDPNARCSVCQAGQAASTGVISTSPHT